MPLLRRPVKCAQQAPLEAITCSNAPNLRPQHLFLERNLRVQETLGYLLVAPLLPKVMLL